MTAPIRASIVIPAFNEAANIEAVVAETVTTFAASAWTPFQVVVVDDGSSDDTARLIDAMAAADPRIRAVHHDGNKGFGVAIHTGIAAADGEFITYLPGDGQLSAADAIVLLDGVEGGPPLMIARRIRKATPMRNLLTKGFQLATLLILGLWIYNTPSHFAARASLVKGMPLMATSGTVFLEIMLRCRKSGQAIGFCPIKLRQRAGGQSKMANFATALAMFRELIQLRRRVL